MIPTIHSLIRSGLALAAVSAALPLSAQTVTWAGGNGYGSWFSNVNWTPTLVPTNGGGAGFTVIIPASAGVSYDLPRAGTIDALSLGSQAGLRVTAGGRLTVTGPSILRGQVDARGAGTAFLALTNQTVLSDYPQLFASDGAEVAVGASSYAWARYDGSTTLLWARGGGSHVRLPGATSLQITPGSGGRVYTLAAQTNGTLDFPVLGEITGPADDDWLDILVQSGGTFSAPQLRRTTGRVRFFDDVAAFELPALERVSDTWFYVASNRTARLPALFEAVGGEFNVQPGATVDLPALASVNGTALTVVSNATLIATNVAVLRDTTVVLGPGQDVRLGSLNDILAARFAVTGGRVLKVNATSYDTYDNWRWSPTLFLAEGTGSRLDLASLSTLSVRYGCCGGYTYGITANSNGVIDLSGTTQVNGMTESDDRLEFNVRNGGSILLPALRKLTRFTRFNLEVPQYTLPVVETIDSTDFNLGAGNRLDLPLTRTLIDGTISLGDGAVVNLPSVQDWTATGLGWGFNSTVNAPELRHFENADLVLSPGRIFNSPLFTNCNGARLIVSGGRTWKVAAKSYDTYDNWRWSPTLLSADGTGSRLDLSSMETFSVRYGCCGGYTYSVTANNNGVIDFSGLTQVNGATENDDRLEFNLRNGGTILFPALRVLTRYTRFNIEVPQFTLPAVETIDNADFNVGTGNRLDLPLATALTGGTVSLGDGAVADIPAARVWNAVGLTWGFNSTVNAGELRHFENCDLQLTPGRTFNAPMFTNINASRLGVAGGRTLRVAATSYDTYDNWRWSPTLLSADGAGSLLDLSSLRSFSVRYGCCGGYTYSVIANNFGVIDLSGTEQVNGMVESDDRLAVTASGGGSIRLGRATLSRYATHTITGVGSSMDFAALNLRAPVQFTATGRGTLRVRGPLQYDLTSPGSFSVDGATILLDGAGAQTLEVGGRDVGPSAGGGGFAWSQIMVGTATNPPTAVRLVDQFNNGFRGAGGQPEALYLTGLDGTGLRLVGGSRLLLNGLKAYAMVSGQWVSLNALIPPGSNSVAFDQGILANSAGPAITNQFPRGRTLPSVDHVDVTFDMTVQPGSFSVADVTVTGPSGSIPVSSVTSLGGTTWRISFASQSADGAYRVSVGPSVADAGGLLGSMDQDADGLAGEVVEDVYQGEFILDSTAPIMVSALAVQNGTRVGVTFNEVVDPAWATNAANYQVNGVVPLAAILQSGGSRVALEVPALVGDSFALTAVGARDPLGNQANRLFNGGILALESRDLGAPGSNPRELGSALTFEGAEFEVTAGGSSIWNSSDAGHFVFEPRAGDFDVRVRVAQVTGPSVAPAEAGLLWRETTNANSRCVYVFLEPGPNSYYAGIRAVTGGSMVDWHSRVAAQSGLTFPDAWMRLKRQGDVFTAFRGSNGLAWTAFAQVTNTMPSAGYLGLGTSSEDNGVGRTATAHYRDYADILPAILSHPQGQSVASGATVTFGVVARGLPVLAYQWLLNGTPLAGATNGELVLAGVTTNRVGDYRVAVSNPFGAVTSQVATLIVDGVGLGGFEADVTPLPGGNNATTVSDWVRVGRLVAGLDTPVNSSEFARADCAPRTNAILGTFPRGNGVLSVADWTQAGRYAAGLDPLTPAGGPVGPPGAGGRGLRVALADPGTRELRLGDAVAVAGGEVMVPVTLRATGDENAVGFSVHFDPSALRFLGAAPGADAVGATFQVNATQTDGGRLGIVLARPAGQVFEAGVRTVVNLRFRVAAAAGRLVLQTGDSPVAREVAGATAEVQAALWEPGTVRVIAAARLVVEREPGAAGRVLRVAGEPGERYRIETSVDLLRWETLGTVTAGAEESRVLDPGAGAWKQRFYRAVWTGSSTQ